MAPPPDPRRYRKVASLSIASPGKMTEHERRDVVAWLAEQAEHVLAHGDKLTEGRFTAGYSVPKR